MPASARPLREVLAAGMKDARQRLGLRQEDAAARARAYGLSTWIRGTVAQAEVGARRLGLDEVLLLALVYETSLAELIAGDDEELVELTPEARLSAGSLRAMLRGDQAAVRDLSTTVDIPSFRGAHQASRSGRFPDVLGEAGRFGMGDRVFLEHALDEVSDAERYAARKLGTTPERLNMAAMRRWGRTLAQERDRRLNQKADDASARSRQALRGHITRQLMAELEDDLGYETPQGHEERW
jgi:hypothetical protein